MELSSLMVAGSEWVVRWQAMETFRLYTNV